MMRYKFIILPVVLILMACNAEKGNKQSSGQTTAEVASTKPVNTEGYELMRQKCLICHMEKPDPAKRENMLAPPMVKVQEHYKPSFPDKQAFVDVITKWVLNPAEENTRMPGAVRRFKLMPKLPYEESEIRQIAAVLYDYDFGRMPDMHGAMKMELSLNKGQKWQLNPQTLRVIEEIKRELAAPPAEDIASWNQLGRDVFSRAKTILMDKSYSGDLYQQLHNFFGGIEGHMHLLIAARDIKNARKQRDALIKKFESFGNYFE